MAFFTQSCWVSGEYSLGHLKGKDNFSHIVNIRQNTSVAELVFSGESFEGFINFLLSKNEKELNLFIVCSHTGSDNIENVVQFNYFTREKAEAKLRELEEKYPRDKNYIIETTVK